MWFSDDDALSMPGDDTPPDERRGARRIACNAPTTAEPITATGLGPISHMLAQDLSETGLRTSSPDFVPVGTRLLISLQCLEDAEPLRTVGVVVWIEELAHQERWHLGIIFSDLSEEARERLREHTCRLGAER